MSRSNYVYVVETALGVTVMPFTVKREAQLWLTKREGLIKDCNVARFHGGYEPVRQRTMTAEEFVND
jgi:hypothetical protein